METSKEQLAGLRDWLVLNNYSKATIQAYTGALRQFLAWRQHRGLGSVFNQEDARSYILHRYGQQKEWQTINGDYSSMQHFYVHVLKQDWEVKLLPRPRVEHTLPKILSVKDVNKLINAGQTYRDQVFMVLLYSMGLRLSEALGLELSHIDGDRRQLRVVKGKGAKDRYLDMPMELLEILRAYYRVYRPKKYLFNGKAEGSQWGERSAQYAVEQARERAGIERVVTPHVLRHCYATHHLENGTNLVYLMQQMGHKNLKTTAQYLHLCASYQQKVKHPVWELELVFLQEQRE